MEREPIYGSGMVSMGYDEAKRILEIEWSSGKIYQYAVPEHIYWSFRDSHEKTTFFNREIRLRFPGRLVSG